MEAQAAGRRSPMPGPVAAAIAAVFAAALACFLGVGAVLPVLPHYVHGPIGGGDVAVGIVVGAFAVTAVVARPWAGRQADARGPRILVVGGALVMAVGGALLYVRAGVAGLVVARLVVGVGEGIVFTAASAWVVDLAPPDRRGQAISLFGLSVWGGLSAGPALGVLLDTVGGYHAVWAFAALAPLAGAAIAWRRPDDAPRHPPRGPRPPLLAREAVGPGIALALANAGYATMAGFIGLHLVARGGSRGATVFVAFACAVVIARLALAPLPDRLGPRRTAIWAALADALGLAIIAAAGDWPVAIAGAVVMGGGFALLYPALALLVVERVGQERRGSALGTFTAFFDAGFGLGGPIAGALAALSGYGLAFWMAAAFAVASAAIAARLRVGDGMRDG